MVESATSLRSCLWPQRTSLQDVSAKLRAALQEQGEGWISREGFLLSAVYFKPHGEPIDAVRGAAVNQSVPCVALQDSRVSCEQAGRAFVKLPLSDALLVTVGTPGRDF
ncbi:hypothetical protein AAFF_G00158420 [Aldrovandia affinis]|uniref:Uncharacterized protein n=1 Tax=Aldrovandia affinis TaxID=143900 RepID=A0AAD7RN40_9TELE|nr:hypothetical protein AAFF_G00158420 [Aldrovandia affinis]